LDFDLSELPHSTTTDNFGVYPETKKAQLRYFLAIQVTPSLFPAFRSGNRKTSLQGLISLNNIDLTNKGKVLCQVFLKGTRNCRLRSMTGKDGWMDGWMACFYRRPKWVEFDVISGFR